MSDWEDSALAVELIRAGREDLPPVESSRRVEKALGFTPGELLIHASSEGLAAGTQAAAGVGAAHATSKLVWAGSLAVALLGGGAGGFWLAQELTPPSEEQAPTTQLAPPAPPEPLEPETSVPEATPPAHEAPEEEPSTKDAAVVPRAAPQPKPAPAASTTLDEVRALDAARRQIASGQAAAALTTLSEYRTRFPRGVLAPEATFLQVQALLAAGNRSAAERLGRRVLANSPGSVHAARIRKLLGIDEPEKNPQER